MNAWIKVVTNPLGLAAFALSIVLSVLAGKNRARKPAWMIGVIFAMACAALVGGLFLAYLQVQKAAQPTKAGPSPATVNQQHIDQINQQSSGSGAVNAAGVQGSVTTNNAATGEDSTKTKKKMAK